MSGGHAWSVVWHPPVSIPPGQPFGANGVCVCADQLILISHDGVHWGFPGGRPEQGETWRDVLDREMTEEACVTVLDARLLGYVTSRCLDGPDAGLVIVRSQWRADVSVQPWEPRFEVPHRRLVPATSGLAELHEYDEVATAFSTRALIEAGLA